MKKNIVLFLVLILLIIGNVTSVFSSDDQDPVVTLSYVEKRVREIKDYIDLKIEEVSTSSVGNSSKYEVVNVEAGKTVIFEEDSLEFILRVGEAKVVIDENSDGGIADLTDGLNLDHLDAVRLNHHMLVPKDDGRGVILTEDSWLMIKGKYTIKE